MGMSSSSRSYARALEHGTWAVPQPVCGEIFQPDCGGVCQPEQHQGHSLSPNLGHLPARMWKSADDDGDGDEEDDDDDDDDGGDDDDADDDDGW